MKRLLSVVIFSLAFLVSASFAFAHTPTRKSAPAASPKAQQYFERMMTRFEAAVERLEKLIGRIESRIDKIKKETPDENLSNVESQLNDAKDKLQNAKDKMQDLKNNGLSKNIGKAVRDLKRNLVEVHGILVHVIGDIKGLRVGQENPKP